MVKQFLDTLVGCARIYPHDAKTVHIAISSTDSDRWAIVNGKEYGVHLLLEKDGDGCWHQIDFPGYGKGIYVKSDRAIAKFASQEVCKYIKDSIVSALVAWEENNPELLAQVEIKYLEGHVSELEARKTKLLKELSHIDDKLLEIKNKVNDLRKDKT